MKLLRSPAGTAPRKVAKPKLGLRADRRYVKQNETITVGVDFKGLDAVEFTLAPSRRFSLDLKTITRKGAVRLKGLRDGIATLIATGRVGQEAVIEKKIHLECEGPTVRLPAFGYIPG